MWNIKYIIFILVSYCIIFLKILCIRFPMTGSIMIIKLQFEFLREFYGQGVQTQW